MPAMKTVRHAGNAIEAHLLVGYLQVNGIEAWVEDEALSAVTPMSQADHHFSPRIMVRDADHERAKALLGERLPGGACNR
jgi:hypothetical protein